MSEALVGLMIFATAGMASFVITPWTRMRALRAGRIDLPGGRKTQEEAVPYGGGLAIFLAFSLTLFIGFLSSLVLAEQVELVAKHLAGLEQRWPTMAAIVFGAGLMLVMGRLDDRRPLHPGLRFIIQVVAALPLAMSEQRLTLFIAAPGLQILVALLWLVFITNAANFIDNMDGLLVGTALIAAVGFAALAAIFGQLFVCAFALALAGSLSGVLPHNRRPARVYLGDEGSMFVGFLLGSLAMVTSYRTGTDSGLLPFIVPLLVMIVPVLDASVAIVGRIGRGLAPWTPGRDHLSHRLLSRGFRPRGAVRLLQALGALGAAGASAVYAPRPAALIFAALFIVVGAIRLAGALRERS